MQSVEQKIVSRIYGKGRGWICSQTDFADLGARASVDKALQSLVAKDTILRVIRGIYSYPEFSKYLNTKLPTSVYQVAQALARKNKWNIQPTGGAALNLLGLSTQVQGRYAYMSDGPSRVYDVNGQELIFRHTAVRDAGFKLRESALLVQGLKTLGPKRITDATITKLRKIIPDKLKPRILKDTRTAVAWVRDAILKICQGDS